MQGSCGLILSMPTPIEHRTASQTERKPDPALGRNLSIPPPTSHVAFCVWPICPATRSTDSAGMKQSFGARRARTCLLSMHCIIANHKTEGAVSLTVVGETSRPADAMTIELLRQPRRRCLRKTASHQLHGCSTGTRGRRLVRLQRAWKSAPLHGSREGPSPSGGFSIHSHAFALDGLVGLLVATRCAHALRLSK